MGRDLISITQYELTNDIIKNHYVFDLKDGALKVLLILSAHYPEIYIQRKSLINRYKIPEKTVDRALKELAEKRYIDRQNDGKITVNLAVIYSQIGGDKVVNLAVTCSNKHDRTNKANKHATNNSQIDSVVVSLLKGFSFSDDEIHQLVVKHSTESLQLYAKYVQLKNADNPKKYLLWCLKEKPALNENKQVVKTSKYTDNSQRYAAYMTAKSYNWLNSKQHAETFLVNTTQFDLRNDAILKDCIAIMLHWKFAITDYSTLTLIDNAAAENEDFKHKTAKLAAEVMEDLKTAKLTVESSNSPQPIEIAC